MIEQFKKTALLQALLGLVSLSSTVMAIAQDDLAVSSSTEYADSYHHGQSFYQQYYLSPQQIAASTRKDVKASALCPGTWVTPIAKNTNFIKDPTQTTSVINADQGYYNPQGTSLLEGNVTIDQEGRSLQADQVEIDSTQTYANAQGHVQIAQNGLFSQSDQVNYNLKTQIADLHNSHYISEQQQAHGYAQQIKRTAPQVVVLENASFSTCNPTASPAWHIQAKSIELNQETGRGITKDARLYVKNVPVLPIPYFDFPIDNRRTSGLLTPNFGYTNNGGLQLSLPYYFNLAPNYDLTATPRYLGGRGVMLEGDFRYLTEDYGQGQIWGGYLPNDQKYNDQDRKDLHWKHLWKINPQWQTAVNLNYVSDAEYFSDLGTSVTSEDTVYQERTWLLNYGNGIPGLTAQLRIQQFQTLDKTILDVNRPYARLPQFLLNYEGGDYNGFEYSFVNDTAYFKKSIDDDSGLESSGTRIYNEVNLAYNFREPGFYITPKLTGRSINTYYDRDSRLSLGYSENESVEKSVAVPQFTLDAGMTFEKEGDYLQTISPRLFYAYAPYHDQSSYPNFDTAAASVSYDQLFSPYRFYGHDRLEDNNFASLGLSYQLYDKVGLERLKASLGQSFYFDDRRVLLSESDQIATAKTSGPVLTVSSQLSNNINVVGNTAWLPSGETSLGNVSLNYADNQGRLYGLGYFYRRYLVDQGQLAYNQIGASLIQPINNNWRVLAHVQYDLRYDLPREWIVGLNYESCCWGVSIYGRSYYSSLVDPTAAGVKPNKVIMAEFSLKGLGGLSGKLTTLLENRVIGFDHVNQIWTQR